MLNRRGFIAAAAAAVSAPKHFVVLPALRPEQFGARGDGRTDDTAALQHCVDAAPTGAAIQLRPGAVYRINTNYEPTHQQFGGVKLKTGTMLQLNGATLKALPSPSAQGCVLSAYLANDWHIEGPGLIAGERDVHVGTGGEWGMGIACWAARAWMIGPGVKISNCWGDGIYLGQTPRLGDFCEDYRIEHVEIHDCRRCGIGHVAGRNGQIAGAVIHNIRGTAPNAAIDFEADRIEDWNRNVVVSGARIYDCTIGIDVSKSNENITITRSNISADNSGVIIGQPVRNIRIQENLQIASTQGGKEGAALRTAVGARSDQVSDVRIIDNRFCGGGQFVLDMVGDGYRDVLIQGNDIHASNAGAQGIARLGRVTFTDNRCVVETVAGKSGDYFLYIAGGSYGGNVYDNRSGRPMHSVLIRSRSIAPDRYETPNLTKIIEQ